MALVTRSGKGDILSMEEMDANFSGLADGSLITGSGVTDIEASNVNVTQSGSGAVSTTVQDQLRLTYWPEQFGAVRDGSTDDVTKVQAALDALDAAGGGTLRLATGTYACSTALNLPDGVWIVGSGNFGSFLLFTGATDGIEISDDDAIIRISDVNIRTSNASGGKAIHFSNSTNASARNMITNVEISFTGSGRWAYGWWGANTQTSEMRQVRCFKSCTVGFHLGNACSANTFYNCEVVGSDGAGTIERGLEAIVTSGTYAFYWYGGVLQGYFTKSAFYAEGVKPRVWGMHVENTNASPSDGADVMIVGTCVGAILSGLQGGDILTSGTVRALNILGGEPNNITLASGCQAGAIIGVRAESITDTAALNTVLGCSNHSGTQYENKVVGVWTSQNDTTIDALGTAATGGFLTAQFQKSLWALDSGGTAREILIPCTTGDDTYLQCKAGENLNLRNGTTLKLQITANGVFPQSQFGLKRTAPTYGATVAIDAALGNEFDITVTDTNNFTIANPTNDSDGQRITITVRNTSGDVMGAITWGSEYKMASWTNPADTFSRSIDFKYNGTNWVEVSRTPDDVPN